MPDFAKCFFVRYAQIYEAYVERTLIKFVYSWRKSSRKSGCKRDSESTSIIKWRDDLRLTIYFGKFIEKKFQLTLEFSN